MATTDEVILQVDIDGGKSKEKLGALLRELSALREGQKKLREEKEKGAKTDEEFAVENQKLTNEIKLQTKQIKDLTNAVVLQDKKAKEYGDTLNDERSKLADMQSAYAALTKAERESAKGKEFRDKIKEQSDLVKGLEKNIGDTRRNVGNYTEALKQAGVGIDGFTSKLKALLANPVALFFAAIVSVVKSVVDAFKHSEDRTNELKKAFAPLQGALDLITKGFDALAKILSKFIVAAIEKVTAGLGWLARKIDSFARALGFEFNLADQLAAAEENTRKLQAAEEAYIKHKREFVEREAGIENELAKLRSKIEEKDKYGAEQRIKFLEQSNALELSLAKERQQLAKEALNIAELEAQRAENSAEANDKLAQARAAVIQADTEYYNSTIKLRKKLAAARAEIAAEEKAAAAEWAKYLADMEREELTAMEQLQKDADKALADEIADEMKRTDEVRKFMAGRYNVLVQFGLEAEKTAEQKEFELLDSCYEQKLLSEEEYQLARAHIEKRYAEERAQAEEKEINEATEKMKAAQNEMATNAAAAFSTLSELMKDYAGQSAEANAAMTAFAMTSLLVTQAQSIANGAQAISAAVAGAASAAAAGGPTAPILLAAYSAQMVGSVLAIVGSVASSIAQAKKIMQEANSVSAGKFEHGGIVGGTSYTGDKLNIRANSAEMILTRQQQKRLFDIANGGAQGSFIDYETLGAVMADAVSKQPAPVMNYREFTNFADKVTTYNELSKI